MAKVEPDTRVILRRAQQILDVGRVEVGLSPAEEVHIQPGAQITEDYSGCWGVFLLGNLETWIVG